MQQQAVCDSLVFVWRDSNLEASSGTEDYRSGNCINIQTLAVARPISHTSSVTGMLCVIPSKGVGSIGNLRQCTSREKATSWFVIRTSNWHASRTKNDPCLKHPALSFSRFSRFAR